MKLLHGFIQGEWFILAGPKDLWEEGGKQATQGQVSICDSQRATWENPTENKITSITFYTLRFINALHRIHTRILTEPFVHILPSFRAYFSVFSESLWMHSQTQ